MRSFGCAFFIIRRKEMKRKIVKSIAYFIAIVLLILSVSGCSQNHATNSGNSSSDITISGNNSLAENNAEPQTEHISEVPDGYIGIYTVEDLQNSTYNTEANYILMNDLDLSSVADWDGINNDSVFDGNNYTISNLKSTKSGLFLNSDSIVNLNLENVDINLKENVEGGDDYPGEIGALARFAHNVENCTATGKLNYNKGTAPWQYIGGMVGRYYSDDTSIKNCKCGVNITYKQVNNDAADSVIGGICGEVQVGGNKKIENCEYYGTITAENVSIGGILGRNFYQKLEMNNCTFSGTISCNFNNNDSSYVFSGQKIIGGILGHCDYNTVIKNCRNIGEISANVNLDEVPRFNYSFGGIVGNYSRRSVTLLNCYLAGEFNIQGENKQVGALIGSDSDSDLHISNCAYLKNDSYGIIATNAMFANCKAMTEEKMQDINNYPFDNKNEWKNVKGSYPIHNATNETA